MRIPIGTVCHNAYNHRALEHRRIDIWYESCDGHLWADKSAPHVAHEHTFTIAAAAARAAAKAWSGPEWDFRPTLSYAGAIIVVLRPHQRPAQARSYESKDEFVRAWVNGEFDRFAHATSVDEQCGDRDPTYEDALEAVGHDLYALTVLENAGEVARYLSERNYAGHHNKGLDAVQREALLLDWFPDERKEAEHDDD